jgi:hypothetical protein
MTNVSEQPKVVSFLHMQVRSGIARGSSDLAQTLRQFLELERRRKGEFIASQKVARIFQAKADSAT